MLNYRFISLSVALVSLFTTIFIYYKNLISKPITPEKTSVLTRQKFIEQAQDIVIKISTEKTSGSGIVISRANTIYTIITNRHVIARGNTYQIKTSDNNIYTGTLVAVSQEDDLAVLQFTSDRQYTTATINREPLPLGVALFTAGFSFNSDQLQITSGTLSLQSFKPLKQGYQLGYTNKIYQGMSGGAIFNSLGEVVGMNGRSANPIIPVYQYQDESYPSQELQQQMRELSWGVPIVKAIALLSRIEND